MINFSLTLKKTIMYTSKFSIGFTFCITLLSYARVFFLWLSHTILTQLKLKHLRISEFLKTIWRSKMINPQRLKGLYPLPFFV